MDSNKVILWPVIISIIGHVALISVSGMVDLRDNVQTAEIFTVALQEPKAERTPPKEETKELTKPQKTRNPEEAKTVSKNGWREDTVDLGSSDVRYSSYLLRVKRRILQIWQYPQKAYDQNEEGVVVVKMSIDASGRLAGANLLSTSGSMLLDDGALGVVRRAAPFESLPVSYSLSRLHIVASFSYKLVE
jgi:periplasmic protein TonB